SKLADRSQSVCARVRQNRRFILHRCFSDKQLGRMGTIPGNGCKSSKGRIRLWLHADTSHNALAGRESRIVEKNSGLEGVRQEPASGLAEMAKDGDNF